MIRCEEMEELKKAIDEVITSEVVKAVISNRFMKI